MDFIVLRQIACNRPGVVAVSSHAMGQRTNTPQQQPAVKGAGNRPADGLNLAQGFGPAMRMRGPIPGRNASSRIVERASEKCRANG